jgi:hypothetical protein
MAQGLSSDRQRAPVPLRSEVTAARDQVRAARRRHRRKARQQGRSVAIVIILVAAALVGVGVGRRIWQEFSPQKSGSQAGPRHAPSSAASAGTPAHALPSVDAGPLHGAGTFAYSTTTGAVHGTAGVLKRFRVAVENGSGQDVAAFAAATDQILGDGRGWTASTQLRLQRVSGQAAADFTIFLATPVTSEAMCVGGGLHTDQYTSCRLPGKVIINLARWLSGVPDYGAGLPVYQAYALNHELGHEFGNGHEACPGAGEAAPVMQQQTLGLKGCVANAWPYVAGQRYSGPKVP